MSNSRRLTLTEVVKQVEDAPIWVVNNTGTAISAPQPADVVISVPASNGEEPTTLRIPQSWLPYCITDHIPRSELLNSSAFRQTITAERLLLITEEYANEVLATEEAKSEMQRLQDIKYNVEHARELDKLAEEAEVKEEKFDSIFLARAKRFETMPDTVVKNELKMLGSLSIEETEYLVDVLRNKPETVGFLKDRLASTKRGI